MPKLFEAISGEKILKKAKKENAFKKISTNSLLVYSILVYIFMFFPLLVMVLMSFNDSKVQGLPIVGLTMQWYADLFSDLELWVALLRSFIVSIGAVVISIVIGLCSAFLLNRYNFPGKSFYRTVIMLPLIIPGVILGISLLSTFDMLGMKTSLITVMIGHSTFILPLIVFVLLNRLERMDQNLEAASLDLGANRRQTFRFVILPSISTALLGGSLLGFTLSFDEIILTNFLIGTKATLPVKIYQRIRIGFTPEINAIFTLLLVFTLVLLLLSTKLILKESKK